MAGRILGWLLVAAALLAAGGDLVRSLERGQPALLTLGDAWAAVGGGGLEAAGAALRGLHPWLWDTAAAWLLRQPVAGVALVAGMVVLVVFRPRQPRRERPTFGNRIG